LHTKPKWLGQDGDVRLPRLTVGVTAFVLMLAGCTGFDSDDVEPEPIPTFVPPPLEAQAELGAAEGLLKMLVRPGYAEPDQLAAFQRDTGCQVTATPYDSGRELDNGLAAGGWDLVAAPGWTSLGLVGDGSVVPLNLDLIPSYGQVFEDLKNRRWNTWNGITYGVPQGRSPLLLAARTDVVTSPLSGLDALFAASSPWPVAWQDSPSTLAAAAVVDGIEDPFALTGGELVAAADRVAAAEPAAVLWATEVELYDALASGAAAVALAPQPVVDRLVASAVPIQTQPLDATLGVSDSWLLTSDAEHPNCAYRWLDYTVRGAVQAPVATRTGQAPASTDACVLAPDLCTNTGAQDTALWASVTIEVTPIGDCLDGRDDVACTDVDDWAAAWERATISTASPAASPTASQTESPTESPTSG
jgi:putative spermidine/putrescine transport system substrate-binding protein